MNYIVLYMKCFLYTVSFWLICLTSNLLTKPQMRILSFIIVFLIITTSITAQAANGDTFVIEGLEYTITSEENHEVEISGYESSLKGDMTIPSTITNIFSGHEPSNVTNNSSDYKVVSIGQMLFQVGIRSYPSPFQNQSLQ